MANFGELLAELRQDNRLTQKELGEIIHVTAGTISNYENGIHPPATDKLTDLADFFHVTVDYLLGRCVSNLSVDYWNQTVLEDLTAGEIIQTICGLSAERKQALAVMLRDLKMISAEESSYGKGTTQ